MKGERWLLSAILLTFLALGIYYSVTVPIFEAPDEIHHYFYVKHLADGNSLPVQDPNTPNLWAQEGSQPPLYYALAALVTSPVDTTRALDYLRPNPHRNVGAPFQPGNKNYMVHTPREAWPYRSVPLAVHLARWFSLLLGAGTVYVTYRIARDLIPDRPYLALTTAATAAFIPQFIFISASVTNDNMINLVASLAIWQMVRLVLHDNGYGRVALLGLLVGLAALSKLSGLGLVALGPVAFWLRAYHRRTNTHLLLEVVLYLAVAGAVAGWWYARNYLLYGDWTGLNRMLDVVGYRVPAPTLADLPAEFRGLRWSFWGLFGWFNVPMGIRAYRLLDLIMVAVGIGLVWGAVRHTLHVRDPRVWATLLLPAWLTILVAGLVRWVSLTPGAQGRLLFPAISAIALLLVLGWSRLVPHLLRPFWAATLPLGLLALALVAPGRWIVPAYAWPPRIGPEEIPPTARRVDLTFGKRIRVLAVEIPQVTTHPGDWVDVTLYLTRVGELPVDYTLFIHLLGREREVVGSLDTFTGWGTYPTQLWQEGEVIVDHYRVQVDPGARVPTLMRVDIGFYNYWDKRELPRLTSDGLPTVGIVGSLRLVSPTPTVVTPQVPVEATFGSEMALQGMDPPPGVVRPGDTIRFRLYWEALRPARASYTIFTHLVGNEDPTPVAQHDKPPLDGDYPTMAWAPGEVVVDAYEIQVPPDVAPGTYRLIAGVYHPQTLERLPLDAGPADPVVENGVTLFTLRVEPTP